MNLFEEFQAVVGKLEVACIPYALCGGLSMAIYGMPRATLAIDLLIPLDYLFRTREIVAELGFTLSGSALTFHGGDIQIYRLAKVNPLGEHLLLDLLIVTPAIQPAWDRRVRLNYGGRSVAIVSPDGLVLMKTLRNNLQDQNDIAYLSRLAHLPGPESGGGGTAPAPGE